MSPSGTTSNERTKALRRALKAPDTDVRLEALHEVITSSVDPETVVAVPVLLRALAANREPQEQIVDALRALGLRRVAMVLEQHMDELLVAARERFEPPDEDELDELPALD